MTDRQSDDDAALDAAFRELPEPELPTALRQRLEAIPGRGSVRRLPRRSWRISAVGWAAAAAVGLFLGAQSIDEESLESASLDETAESPSPEAAQSARDEDESLALAVGSFTEFEEEP